MQINPFYGYSLKFSRGSFPAVGTNPPSAPGTEILIGSETRTAVRLQVATGSGLQQKVERSAVGEKSV